jgi:hypothetical protein
MIDSGNGPLTYEEAKSHFTAWALMKSPLLIGTDVSQIHCDEPSAHAHSSSLLLPKKLLRF